MPSKFVKDFRQGQTIWVTGTVIPGMFPHERYFQVQLADLRVCGYVAENKTKDDKVLAVVMEVVGDRAQLLFPGELLCANNPVPAPILWLKENIAA